MTWPKIYLWKFRQNKVDSQLGMLLLFSTLSLVSTIRTELPLLTWPDVILLMVGIAGILSQLMVKRVSALHYQAARVFNTGVIEAILLHTAYRHAMVQNRPSTMIIWSVILIALCLLLLQLPSYIKAMRATIPENTGKEKIDFEKGTWNIHHSYSYNNGLMEFLGYIGALALMIFSWIALMQRGWVRRGHLIPIDEWSELFSYIFIFFVLILIAGSARMIAETWLVWYLEKTRNVKFFIEEKLLP